MADLLTTKTVEKLKATPGKRREVPDGLVPGLYCVVHSSGAKAWAFRYRRPVDGRPAKLTLGPVYIPTADGPPAPEPAIGVPLGLADARRLARDVRISVDLGRDPAGERKDDRAARQAELAETFRDVLEEYVARHASKKNRSALETKRLIEVNCATWLDRPVRSIARRDVRDLLDSVVDRGSPVMANRLRAYLGALFSWAEGREIVSEDPMRGVANPTHETPRDRVLDDVELVEVWRAAKTLGYPYGALVQLLILTGQRRGESAAMRWSDLQNLEGDEPIWIIPAEFTKTGKMHHLPLSPEVVSLICELPRFGEIPYVFTSGRTSDRPLSGWTKYKGRLDTEILRRRREAAGETGQNSNDIELMPDWTLHDLRRTVRTGFARLGVAPHIGERVLNHSSGSSRIAAIYDRYQYGPEQRQALCTWAGHIVRIVSERSLEDFLDKSFNPADTLAKN